MLNSQDNNSFRENLANNIEEIGLFKAQLIKDSRSRLKLLFLQDPLSHEPDPKYKRVFSWFLFHPFSVEDYTHIFYFLTSFGFKIIGEGNFYRFFRKAFPKEIFLNVEVQKMMYGFNITAYVDIEFNNKVIHNTLTASLLSELAYYLQKVDSESQTITRTTPKPLELDKQGVKNLSAKGELFPKENQAKFKKITSSVAATTSKEDFNPHLGIINKPVTPNRTKIIKRFSKKENRKINKNLLRLKANKEKEEFKLSQEAVLLNANNPTQKNSCILVLDHEEIFGVIEDGRKSEDERVDREIQPFITAFCEAEFEIIYQEALENGDYLVEREDIEKRIRADYEQKVKRINSLYKECYPIKFEIYIGQGFDCDFNSLTRRLRLLYSNSKPRIVSQLKAWVLECKGDIAILHVIIGLILTTYLILEWMIKMPMLKFFDFFNNNLWIVFLIGFLIFVTVVLIILFINSVKSYWEESSIN